MSPRAPVGAGDPDEVNRGLAELQRYVAAQASTPEDHTIDADAGVVGVAGDDVGPAELGGSVPAAGSRRVRRLRAQVGEAHALLGLQADEAPLLVESRVVRRRRRRAVEAARLHQLAQDPAARAWQAAWWRRALTAAAMTALVLALGWSTAGVQRFAAGGAPAGSAAWWLAWLVEPLISLALLAVVGAKAFFATRGHPLDHPRLTWIERGFLAITLTMNIWPYLPGVAAEFAFSALFVHAIGPVVAVSVVAALPIIWQHFVDLDHGPLPGPPPVPYSIPTTGKYSHNAVPPPISGRRAPAFGDLVTRARALIAEGVLPARPSATQLRAALGCGTDTARRLRDTLASQDGAP